MKKIFNLILLLISMSAIPAHAQLYQIQHYVDFGVTKPIEDNGDGSGIPNITSFNVPNVYYNSPVYMDFTIQKNGAKDLIYYVCTSTCNKITGPGLMNILANSDTFGNVISANAGGTARIMLLVTYNNATFEDILAGRSSSYVLRSFYFSVLSIALPTEASFVSKNYSYNTDTNNFNYSFDLPSVYPSGYYEYYHYWYPIGDGAYSGITMYTYTDHYNWTITTSDNDSSLYLVLRNKAFYVGGAWNHAYQKVIKIENMGVQSGDLPSSGICNKTCTISGNFDLKLIKNNIYVKQYESDILNMEVGPLMGDISNIGLASTLYLLPSGVSIDDVLSGVSTNYVSSVVNATYSSNN
jgi:hypothetical protein